MKKISFITALSPEKQHEIYRWFWCSFFLCVSALVVGMFCIITPLLTYRALKKEVLVLREQTKIFAQNVQAKDARKVEYDTLNQYMNKIERYKKYVTNTYEHIAAIFALSGDGVKIEAMHYDKKNSEITILCPTSEHVTLFIKRLSTLDKFTDIKLISLHYDTHTKQFRAVIKITIYL